MRKGCVRNVESEFAYNSEPESLGRRDAARHLGRAVRTLLVTPLHPRVYRVIKEEDVAAEVTIPLQPEIPQLIDDIKSRVLPKIVSPGAPMSGPDTVVNAGLLMQFSNHFNELPREFTVPYQTVADLGRACMQHAGQDGRLSMTDQLELALDQSEGDLGMGLRNMFVTSRMYARWLDKRMVTDTPEVSTAERLQQMRGWQDSLLGFKSGGSEYHDAAGDNYYAWTHVYAGYMLDRLQVRPTLPVSLARTAFRNGTRIMQTCVNNLNPRGTISDHTIAARYGNVVADELSDYDLES